MDVTDIKIDYTKFKLHCPNINEDACSTIIFGSSKSGKTTQVIDIINKYFNDKNLIVIFMSSNIHKPIYDTLPKTVIKLDRWDENIIKHVHHIQKKTKNKYRFLFASDDIIDNKNNKMIQQLILTLRNSLINSIICLQDTKLLSRTARNNGNNFIFRHYISEDRREDAIKLVLNGYQPFHSLRNLNEKKGLYQILTKDYGFIYLDALDGRISFHKKNN